jgi:hypothetical protein
MNDLEKEQIVNIETRLEAVRKAMISHSKWTADNLTYVAWYSMGISIVTLLIVLFK